MKYRETPEQLERLVCFIKEASLGSYISVKVLADGSIAAIGDLMFTRAIYLGCNALGFESRFCFEDRELANKRYAELKTEEDNPHGYIARRGRVHPSHYEAEKIRLAEKEKMYSAKTQG